MATFTTIEFNGDHLADLRHDFVGTAIANIIANPFNVREYEDELGRVLRVVKVSMHPTPKGE